MSLDKLPGAGMNIEMNDEGGDPADNPVVKLPLFPPDRYETQKARIEKHFARLWMPGAKTWVELNDDGGFTPVKKTYVYEAIDHLKYKHFFDPLDEEKGYELKPFALKFVTDHEVRLFERVVYDPYNTNPLVLNGYPRHKAWSLPPVHDADLIAEVKRRVMAYFENLIPDSAQRKFVLVCLANQLQNPRLKTMVIVVLEGDPGCGKNLFTENVWGYGVLGDNLYTQEDGLGAIFEQFSDAMKQNVMVQCDEVSACDSRKFVNRLKNSVTSKKVKVEEKQKQRFTYENFANVWMTTNDTRALHIQPGDRRFFVAECVNAGEWTQEDYYRELQFFQRDDVIRVIYDWFRDPVAFDLREYRRNGFQNMRPKSESYYASQRASADGLYKYFSSMCEKFESMADYKGEDGTQRCRIVKGGPHDGFRIQVQQLHTFFIDFLKKTGFADTVMHFNNASRFCDKMNVLMLKNPGVCKKIKVGGVNWYVFDMAKLKESMVAKGFYDEDMASWDPW